MTVHTFLREDVDVLDYGTGPYCTLGVKIRCAGSGLGRCAYTYRLGFSPQGVLAVKRWRQPPCVDLVGTMQPEPSVISARPIPDPRPVITVRLGDVIVVEGYGSFEIGPPTIVDYDRPTVEATPWPES